MQLRQASEELIRKLLDNKLFLLLRILVLQPRAEETLLEVERKIPARHYVLKGIISRKLPHEPPLLPVRSLGSCFESSEKFRNGVGCCTHHPPVHVKLHIASLPCELLCHANLLNNDIQNVLSGAFRRLSAVSTAATASTATVNGAIPPRTQLVADGDVLQRLAVLLLLQPRQGRLDVRIERSLQHAGPRGEVQQAHGQRAGRQVRLQQRVRREPRGHLLRQDDLVQRQQRLAGRLGQGFLGSQQRLRCALDSGGAQRRLHRLGGG
mmetsp:Transcript_15807/g.30015  ORF Transcript_15807/g.30015 Transcript_15807/m.30015 type:complete len:266 (+) Transcript_15807:1023-1820(+)